MLCGFGNSLAWTNLGVYFTSLSKQYSNLAQITFQNAQSLLFGWFSCILLFSYVFGASWVGGILQLKELDLNSTAYDYANNCGMGNCPQTQLLPSTSKPSLGSVYALCATLIASCLVAIVITALFVDDLRGGEENEEEDGRKMPTARQRMNQAVQSFKDEIGKLMTLFKTLDIWLLMPIAMYLGFELTLIWYEYSRVSSQTTVL